MNTAPAHQADQRPDTDIDPGPDDLDLFADRRLKPTRLTVLLLALIVAALAFGGGVLVQKHYGTNTSAAAGGFPGATGQRAGGAGGYGGFGGQGGSGVPGAQTGQSQAQGQGTSAASSTPVVVGTVTKISGNVLTVKNFAGKTVKVTVPEGSSVTLVAGSSLTGLETGNNVSVAGTTSSDGSVRASSVTVTGS